MKSLNTQILSKFLKQASSSLTGEWILVGGTLLPALGLNVRSTVDIDLIPLTKKDNSQTLELMKLTKSLNLPIETINPVL